MWKRIGAPFAAAGRRCRRSAVALAANPSVRARFRSRPGLVAGAGVALASAGALLWLAATPQRLTHNAVEITLPPTNLPPLSASTAPHYERLAVLARPDPANALTVPAVTAAAFSAIPLPAPEAALPPAPDPALVEDGANGPLPRRGEDGRVVWRQYARPFAAGEDRPRIAVIVSGLGVSPTATGEIIRRLPGAVTLAFEPAASNVHDWAQAARAGGHEILLGLPRQGDDFPFVDPGPDALAPGLSQDENRNRLHALLARTTGYVGVLSHPAGDDGKASGSISDTADPLAVMDADLDARGLLIVGGQPRPVASGARASGAAGVPRVKPDLNLGADDGVAAIRARLALLEALARSRSYAVAVVEPSPVAIAELAAWSGSLAKKNLVLAPVSAVAATAADVAR